MTDWNDLSLLDKAKKIATEYMRGIPVRNIASKYNCPEQEVRRLIKIIDSRDNELVDLDKFLNDLRARKRDQLRSLNEQKTTAWQMLDWAREMVPDRDALGNLVPVLDENGQPTGRFECTPRNVAQATRLLQRVAEIDKQIAEVLALVGQKVDITLQLQAANQRQEIIMETIHELAPSQYAQMHRKLQALPSPSEIAVSDVVDAQFSEVIL